MPGSALVLFLRIVTVAGAALIAVKLYKTDLRRRYTIFFFFFTYKFFNGIWPFFLHSSAGLYQQIWVFTEAINWIFYVLLVGELCRLVLEKHRGLYTLGRWAMYLGVVVSVVLSVVSLLPNIRRAPPQRSKVLPYVFATDRGLTLGLAVFLLLMMFLLKSYPVRLSRNVVLHAGLYTLFFISNSLSIALSSILGRALFSRIDTGLMVVSASCILMWLLFLNPRGEEVQVNVPNFSPEHEEKVLSHLEALNATLLKARGK